MLKQSEVSATRIQHSGAWECAAVVHGYRTAKVYYGYTKREAIRLFVSEINNVLTKVEEDCGNG